MRGRGDMSKQNYLPKTSLWLSVKTHKDVLNVKVFTDWGLIASSVARQVPYFIADTASGSQ